MDHLRLRGLGARLLVMRLLLRLSAIVDDVYLIAYNDGRVSIATGCLLDRVRALARSR